jgi:predicted nucleic acid-binding protein
MIVVDTNIIAALYLENPHREEVEVLLVRQSKWLAPGLWQSEFRNVLIQYVRHRVITLDDALTIMGYSEELIVEIDYEPSSAGILMMAHSSGCSAYDCEYVALAQDLGTVLITFDRKVLSSFPTIALTPSAFLAASG